MNYCWPFRNSARARESGNVLLVTGMLATAIAVAGGKVMLDRSIAQRKANQLAENNKRAKEIPGSAAMIAKALISLPPHVAGNKSIEWTSAKLESVATNRPMIYPIPYLSGTIGGPPQPATTVAQTSAPQSGANWDMLNLANASGEAGAIFSASVNVYTNDSSRASAQDINSAISTKAVASGSATIKRTKSVVTYSFRNCDINNQSSATFTGRYCASAVITSDSYASVVKGNDTATGAVNKVAVELGGIEPPPPPLIKSVSTSDNGPLRKNTNFSLVVKATGVATGYTVKYGAAVLAQESNKHLSLDHLYETRELVISNINSSALNPAFDDPCQISVVLDVTLDGITGSDPTFSQSFDLAKNLVSCVPGSFSIRRRDDVPDKRTCSIQLSRDSRPGTIKEIQLVQDNISSGISGSQIFGSPVFDGAGNWSFSSFACSQDKFNFTASLVRQSTCPTPSRSLCTPTDVEVPELVPNCDNFMIGRTPNSMTDCTVTVDRAPDSHYGVDVFVNNQRQTGGTWTGNRWEKTNYPCGVGASSNYDVKLVRGSLADACPGSATISENSWCVGVSWSRPAAGKCALSFTKNNAATTANITKIERDTVTVTGGTWSGNVYTSPQFDCPSTQISYQGFLTGSDNRRSSCGFTVVPVAPPVCGGLTATRPTPTSTTCTATMTKAASSGPIATATLNGVNMVPADQATYTTTVSCPLNTTTTVTGSLSNASGTVNCTSATVLPPVCYSNAVGGTTSEYTAAGKKYRVHRFATVGASGNFTVTSSCNPFSVLVVAGGGGGGYGKAGGGGGAGGLIFNNNFRIPSEGSYPVTVGAGGAPRARGQNSSIGTILTAIGGGFGGNGDQEPPDWGASGGSGGGGGGRDRNGCCGGAGTVGQGNAGGNKRGGNWDGGGGGGGAGGGGWAGGEPHGGPGGSGRLIEITGTNNWYAGGGAGAGEHSHGWGGLGGGGGVGGSGAQNTGGGGGARGGWGGSGVVIIRYEIAP